MNPVHDTIAYDSLGRKEEREGGWKGGREGWREGKRKREEAREGGREREREEATDLKPFHEILSSVLCG